MEHFPSFRVIHPTAPYWFPDTPAWLAGSLALPRWDRQSAQNDSDLTGPGAGIRFLEDFPYLENFFIPSAGQPPSAVSAEIVSGSVENQRLGHPVDLHPRSP